MEQYDISVEQRSRVSATMKRLNVAGVVLFISDERILNLPALYRLAICRRARLRCSADFNFFSA